MNNDRSYEKITNNTLSGLLNIVRKDQEDFFNLNKEYFLFKGQLFAILLVQGAALHYCDGKNGIKDFDILVLYRENNAIKNNKGKLIKIYPKRVKSYDSKMEEYGRYPKDPEKYICRRVDILMREIKLKYIDDSIEKTIQNYLKKSKSSSAKKWSEKAVIGIYPNNVFGKILYINIKSPQSPTPYTYT